MEHMRHDCETCGHIFDSDEELREHLLLAHGVEETETDSANTEDEETAA